MCVKIERVLDRTLLRLPCRHHIAEVLLKETCVKVFKISSNSPEGPILKDFKLMWKKLGKIFLSQFFVLNFLFQY